MESHIITFILGFLIDKISLFPFVMGFGLATILNNKMNLKFNKLKEYLQICKKNMDIQQFQSLSDTIETMQNQNKKSQDTKEINIKSNNDK